MALDHTIIRLATTPHTEGTAFVQGEQAGANIRATQDANARANRLSQLKEMEFQQNQKERQRLMNMRDFAIDYESQIKPMIQNNDTQGVSDYLNNKIQSLPPEQGITYEHALQSFQQDPAMAVRQYEAITQQARFNKLIPPAPEGKRVTAVQDGKEFPAILDSQGRLTRPGTGEFLPNATIKEKAFGRGTPAKTPEQKRTEMSAGAEGTGQGREIVARRSMAREAVSQNAQLDRIALAIANGAKTGKFGNLKVEGKKLLQSFGIEADWTKVGEEEMITRIGGEMALRLRNPSSGLGLTGNTSNKDLEFLNSITPNLQRTSQGNLMIISFAKKLNKLKMDIVKEQNRILKEYEKTHGAGATPRDLDEQILNYVDNYKFFSDAERKKIDTVLAEAQGGQTGGPSVGTIEDGYRYNGGDPKNPNSWTKVK